MATKQKNTYGLRRRYRGRMLGPNGAPRSHNSNSKMAKVTFECGQDRPYDTKILPGRFKVTLPPNRIRVRGHFR